MTRAIQQSGFWRSAEEQAHEPLTKITGCGQEQSPTLANTSKLLQAIQVAATTKSNKKTAAKSTTKCHQMQSHKKMHLNSLNVTLIRNLKQADEQERFFLAHQNVLPMKMCNSTSPSRPRSYLEAPSHLPTITLKNRQRIGGKRANRGV